MKLVEKTIKECFVERAEKTPEKVFIKTKNDVYSWKNVDDITEKLSYALFEQGIRKNDKVGIYGYNTPSWIISFIAIQKLGATAVLINSCYKEKELVKCIKIADIKYILYTGIGGDEDNISSVVSKLRKNTDTRNIKTFNIERTYGEWISFFERNVSLNHDTMMSKMTTQENDCQDIACILFTSGTTNDSKGVMLSHYSLVNNAREIVGQMRWGEDDIMCLSVPLFHCFGVNVSLLCSILGGMTISLLKKYKTTNVCRVIQNDKCTILNGVPSMYLALINNPMMKEFDLSSLKSGIIAGSPIYEKDYYDICEKLDGINLQTSYGLTEASPCVSITGYNDSLEQKASSSGKVIDNVEIRIVDLKSNKECANGEVGEIFVKGYNITKGYLTTEPIVCDAVQKDGWLKTGDLGYIDGNGYLYIVGRRKNLIIRGGENISPTEIEKVIKEVKNGINVRVVGKKSEVLQEEIVACIEGKKDDALVEKIKKYLCENLSKYKIPRYYLFIDSFPKNQTGKTDERELKKLVEEAELV
ncbi:class I adenylate-forming enzyme family protein [Peptostreptococcus porci]|uniref:class I adenylate-forming enzyme family protein n=1 Tax=Peptostreptococcus porci TaxID=2652282 RepID=UPI002A91AA17|nr:class I adenylate-forming enzyme family protein [Peptostreptococcus porci]MDY5435375.1 class I adenylate-forming enzyme family protein [Peptostreptococcus porci]